MSEEARAARAEKRPVRMWLLDDDEQRLIRALIAMKESTDEEEASGLRPLLRSMVAEHMSYIQEVRPTTTDDEERALRSATVSYYRWRYERLGKDGLLAWHQREMEQREAARQKRLLRQGHRTLIEIKRVLRGQAPSQPLESEPARTSPTS